MWLRSGPDLGEDEIFHILYDGTVVDEDVSRALGGEAEAITGRLAGAYEGRVVARGSTNGLVQDLWPVAERELAPVSSKWRCSTAPTAGGPSGILEAEVAELLAREHVAAEEGGRAEPEPASTAGQEPPPPRPRFRRA